MKKSIKISLWILCILIFLFLLTAAIFPYWASSTSGQKTVVKWINHQIEGTLTVDEFHLSWWGGQRVKNLNLKDSSEQTLFSVSEFQTDTSLLYLLFGGRTFHNTLLHDPYLVIRREIKEEKDSEKPAHEKKDKKKNGLRLTPPKFSGKLFVKDGTVILSSDAISPITISEIQLEKIPEQDLFRLQAYTQQGETRGKVTIDATFLEKIRAFVEISNFPIAILDELEGGTSFTEAFGPQLNANLEIEREPKRDIEIKGTLKSANLNAYIEGSTQGQKLIINPHSYLEFTVTPKLFKSLIPNEQRADWELASKTSLRVHIENAVFPLPLTKANFQASTLQAYGQIERAELNHKDVGAYSLNHFELSIIALKNLEIEYQGEIQGKESTKLSGQISITPEFEVLYQYTSQGFPVSLLSLFSTSLEQNIRLLFGSQIDIESNGTYIHKQLDAEISLNSADTLLKGSIEGKLPELKFEFAGEHQLHGKSANVIGKSINFTLDGTANLNNRHFSIPLLKAKAYNPYFDLDFRGQIGEVGKPFSLDQIHLIASGAIKELPIKEASLKEGSIYIQLDGPKNLITGKIDSPSADVSLEVNHFIQDNEFSFDQAAYEFKANLKQFPVTILDSLVHENLDLVSLIGHSATIKAEGSYRPEEDPKFALNLDAQSEGFSAQLNIALDDTLLVKQNKSSSIKWQLTPERYDALIRMLRVESEPTFTLINSTQVELSIDQFICPTTPPKDVGQFICQSGFIGNLQIGPSTFRSRQTGESIVFQGINGTIRGENFTEQIDLNLSGSILAANIPQSENSAFSFEGKMLNFWTPDGTFNREGLTVDGVLSLDLIPVRPLTGIVPIDEETRKILQAILGELVNARIYGEISRLSGPLTIDIKASNFKAKLPLVLSPHAIHLRDVVDAEITLTEAVNETLLTDIAPLFITGAYSEHPLKVYIEPQGFVIPIRPYSLQGVQIEKAIIDIGKISVRNGGQVQGLMEFLKAKEITPDGWMEAWFTPIFMNLQNGVASYKRFDALLANTVHIALWGSINLITDQVKMTLGISPATLQQRFNIGGLSRLDLFQVKMRGTTDNLELDWSAASTRIGFLIAKSAGGHLGMLVGGILEQLIKTLGDQPSPPPTTDPLPWESQYPSVPGQGIPQEAPPKMKKK